MGGLTRMSRRAMGVTGKAAVHPALKIARFLNRQVGVSMVAAYALI
jgi:hypothetical protein